MANASQEDIEELIRSTGFFRNKAKNISGAANRIEDTFDGEVPDTMDELLTLPGVARKTANVILGTAFGKNIGVVVDTHIGRLSRRMGFTKEENPVKVERDLMEIFPRKNWTTLGHLLIWHGRRTCDARKPKCEGCLVEIHCSRIGVDAPKRARK
jgi:endonuclease-3